jgi:predicted dehydrogenase
MRVGVVGAGVIGQLRARSVREHAGTELAGVADPVSEAARRAVAGAGATACTDLGALLELPGLEAVIVSTPLPHHEAGVLAALQAGKHVLCEKPLGSSVESCRRMLEAARAAGRVLAVGFNHRYYPAIKFVKRVVDEGRIGTIDHLRVFGGHDGLHNFRAEWQYKAPASGGGAMMDVGIHMTDLTRFILGDIAEVYGVASNRVWKVPGSEDNAVAIFKSPAGIPAFYQATWSEWRGYGFFLDVYGDRGMVRGFYAPMFNLLVTDEGGRRRRRHRFYPEIIIREKLRSWTSTAYRSFQEELTDFLRLIRGEPGTALADGFAGFRATEIADAVYRSSREGTPIRLSPAPAVPPPPPPAPGSG